MAPSSAWAVTSPPAAVALSPTGRRSALLPVSGFSLQRQGFDAACAISRARSSLSRRCCAMSSLGGSIGCGRRGIEDWDWNQWNRYFSDVDQADNYASVLKFQLEEAIEKEDFTEAAKLKKAISEATSIDTVSEVMSELKKAIEDQRYHDASNLSRLAHTGLVGWWVGYAKDSNDSFGRVVRITPAVGRYVAKGYSPRQLLTESSGTPLFEIFLVKDDTGSFILKVVALQSAQSTKGSTTVSSLLTGKSQVKSDDTDASFENVVTEDAGAEGDGDEAVKEKEGDGKRDGDKESRSDAVNDKNDGKEGLKSVINFLKERIPGFKVQVLNVVRPEEIDMDAESLEQLMEQDGKKSSSLDDNPVDKRSYAEENVQKESAPVDDSLDRTEEAANSMKLFVGGVLHKKEDTSPKSRIRVPAEINNLERNSFQLHIPGIKTEADLGEAKSVNVKVAAAAAKLASELMPSDVAKAFWSSSKSTPQVAEDLQQAMELVLTQVQRRNRLSETTSFSRINTDSSCLDPFNGLYVGAFGPYGPEVVQLRRKYGHWNPEEMDEGLEFFEYVEAVKLTGDLNVPAGQVTFCARIGKENRTPNHGIYPEELGVVASYKGQGRIAELGFKKPRWVEGELLQLNGKGLGPHIRGAELGFLYVVPEQSFLVLFDRLKLPE